MTASLPQLLQTAVDKHQAGQLEEAAELYRRCLGKNPNHLDALRLLAILSEQQGDHSQSLALAEKALRLSPKVGELWLLKAEALLGLHQVEDAQYTAEKGLSLDPKNIDLLLFLGDLNQQTQTYSKSLNYYQHAEKIDPDIPELANNLGNLHKVMGDTSAAVASYQKAIRLNGRYVEAYFNLASLFYEQEKYPEALDIFTKTLKLAPTFFQARMMQGVIFKLLGQWNEAEDAYSLTLNGMPPNHPAQALLWYNWGNLYLTRKQLDQAADYYRKSLAIAPDNPATLQNLANVLLEQGEAEEAVHVYGRLSQLCPETPVFRINEALALPVLYQSCDEILRWRENYLKGLDRLLSSVQPLNTSQPNVLNRFVGQLASTGFYLAYQGLDDREAQEKTGALFQKLLGNPTVERMKAPYQSRPGEKPRIAFISRHLSSKHTIGKLMEGIVQRLSRDRFEVHIYSVGSEHAYQPQQPGDPFYYPEDVYIELPIRDFEACMQILSQAELDIAYFPDLGMDVVTALLGHHRFAPVQCTTWGHPVTTGSPNIDYFISSCFVETPNSSAHYTETLQALENYPFYYQRPILETVTVSRDDLGLMPGQHLYTCVQSLFKIHPNMDFIFGEILRRDPLGILVLLSHPSDRCNQSLFNRISQRYPDVMDRIRFVQRLPRTEFLSLMAISDVILDSIYFSGGNTSYEGLAFGTPIITLDSPYMKGRLTLGLYRQMGMTDCIAPSLESYVEKAVHYGRDESLRQELREEILQRCPVLYENESPIRELENFLITALSKPRD